MCAINGIYRQQAKNSHEKLVERMNNCLSSRGPDDKTIYIDDQIILGHTLLAVRDRKANTKQPIIYKDYVIVLNGEIYNYSLLKKRLENKYPFTSQSDAEILIYLYLEYQDDFVRHLDGEFALALFDKKQKKLLLAVDHLAIKPLYYFFADQTFIFSSQINALFATGMIKKELDIEQLYHAFTLGTSCQGKTLFKNIKKMQPGQMIVIKNSILNEKHYFLLKDTNFSGNKNYLKNIYSQLETNIQLRSISMTKIGVLLSGGIDSGLVAYFLNKNRADGYSISLNWDYFDKSIGEVRYQNLIKKHLKNLQFLEVKPKKLAMQRVLLPILEYIDDFAFHPSMFSAHLLFKKARYNNIKVILTGDGADELFFGYDYYLLINELIKVDNKKIFFDVFKEYFKKEGFLNAIYNNYLHGRHLYFSNHFYFYEDQKKQLFNDAIFKKIPETEEIISDHLKPFKHLDVLNQFLIGELSFKMRQPLTILDRLASNQAVEARVPYLSKEMILTALAIPAKEKIKKNQTKYLMKKIAEKRFGKELAYRKKQGLIFPKNLFVNSHKLINILINSRLIKDGLFSKNYLENKLNHALRKKEMTNSDVFLVFFFLWFDYHFEDGAMFNFF